MLFSFKFVDLQTAFNSLGDIIAEFPSLVQNSRFIFVPGPNDPGLGNIMPRYDNLYIYYLIFASIDKVLLKYFFIIILSSYDSHTCFMKR